MKLTQMSHLPQHEVHRQCGSCCKNNTCYPITQGPAGPPVQERRNSSGRTCVSDEVCDATTHTRTGRGGGSLRAISSHITLEHHDWRGMTSNSSLQLPFSVPHSAFRMLHVVVKQDYGAVSLSLDVSPPYRATKTMYTSALQCISVTRSECFLWFHLVFTKYSRTFPKHQSQSRDWLTSPRLLVVFLSPARVNAMIVP
jgi:hypothetical protein